MAKTTHIKYHYSLLLYFYCCEILHGDFFISNHEKINHFMAQNDLDLMFRIHESMNVLINSHLVSDHHSSSSPAAKASWCIYSSFSNLNASKNMFEPDRFKGRRAVRIGSLGFLHRSLNLSVWWIAQQRKNLVSHVVDCIFRSLCVLEYIKTTQ